MVRPRRALTAAVDVPARYAGLALSPDGSRLAFARIDVKGRSDIWVRDLTRGIDSPLTSDGYSFTDGAEIFYVSREKQMVATSFKDGDVGTPRALFRIDSLIDPEDRGIFPGSYPYAVANGQRFLAAINARDPDAPPINIILNWPALLRR